MKLQIAEQLKEYLWLDNVLTSWDLCQKEMGSFQSIVRDLWWTNIYQLAHF